MTFQNITFDGKHPVQRVENKERKTMTGTLRQKNNERKIMRKTRTRTDRKTKGQNQEKKKSREEITKIENERELMKTK